MGRLDCAAKGAQSATRMKPSNIAIPFARTHTSRFTNSHQREDIDADQGKSRRSQQEGVHASARNFGAQSHSGKASVLPARKRTSHERSSIDRKSTRLNSS